jgi:hypothetical protein
MFYLSSEDLGKPNIENIMYEINGNIPLIKNICCSKIAKSFKMIEFDINQIKQLKIFVSKDKDNIYTEIWLDFDTNNDLCFITRNKNLSIYAVQRIEWLVAQWLLSK